MLPSIQIMGAKVSNLTGNRKITVFRKQFNNVKQLNNGNIWITNFHLTDIQMSSIQMVVRYSDPIWMLVLY